jgi:hypothetical protein
MATQLEGAAQMGGSPHQTAALTPQAHRLLNGPVLATLLRLAVPGRGTRPLGRRVPSRSWP